MDLKYRALEPKVESVISELNLQLANLGSEDKIINHFSKEFSEKALDLKKKIKLEIALVGQYSAGKSTIISALTGNQDIQIGQDITTDKPKAYEWGNDLVVDTPGIYAGRADHDKASLEYMDKADLLVYVISTQGFSEETAKNFRELAFVQNRIEKMMLVINKSSQGNKEASRDNWISDALLVSEPKTAKELFLSVIDAQDYIEAQGISEEDDKKDLIAYSGFEDFLINLNKFIKDKGMLGRLIAPLNLCKTVGNKVINNLTIGTEDAKNLQELVSRKDFRLKESKSKLENNVNGKIKALISSIKKEGHKIADLIEKDGDQKIIEQTFNDSNDNIKNLVKDARDHIEQLIEGEFDSLQVELNILMDSELATKLKSQDKIDVNFSSDVIIDGFDKKRLNDGIGVLNNVGKFAEGFASNKDAINLGKSGLSAVSGSEAHKTIYNVGKYFGKNFKPYEALKYADKLGKIGTFIGRMTVVLPFLVATYEEYSENKYAKEIIKKKQEIREKFEGIASEIGISFQNNLEKVIAETYNKELHINEKILRGLRDKDKVRDEDVQMIDSLITKADDILVEIEMFQDEKLEEEAKKPVSL